MPERNEQRKRDKEDKRIKIRKRRKNFDIKKDKEL